MMDHIFRWVTRQRPAVLLGSLLTGTVLAVLLRVIEDDGAFLAVLALGALLPAALLLLSVVGAYTFRATTLVARAEPPAFEVPANPAIVLSAAAGTLLCVQSSSAVLAGTAGELRWLPLIPTVLWAGLLAVMWRFALGRFGVRLHPGGIVDRQVFGSLFVPWQALATPHAARAHGNYRVALALEQPGLVTGRGLRQGGPTSLPVATVHPELLARAIREYANHPDRRTAIGSPEELARLLAAPPRRPDDSAVLR